MRIFAFLLLCSIYILGSSAIAQTRVKGEVKTSDGKPISGAKIITLANVILGYTNNDGSFEVESENNTDSLRISYPEYLTYVFPVSTEFQYITLTSINESSIYDLSLEEIMNIEIKVSSTIGKRITQTPSNVYVIDNKILSDFNFTSVPEAVRIAAGVDILQSNIDANIPTVRGILQNYYANKVLILINGIPTWQPIYGNGYLDRISIHDVERIEILKGPASVLYGTNAYNGVINIILKNNDKNSIEAYSSVGYPGLGHAGVNANLNINEAHLFVGINSGNENRAPYEFEGQRGQLFNGDSVFYITEKINQHNLTTQLNYKQHQAFLNYYDHNYTFPGVAPSYVSGGNAMVKNTGLLSEYRFNGNITQDLKAYFATSYEFFTRTWPDRADRSTALSLAAERVYAILKFNYHLNEYIDMEAGADFVNGNSLGHVQKSIVKDTILRYNMKNVKNIIEYSGFAQLNLSYNQFSLLAGTRYTINETFGSNLSSRVSGVFALNDNNSVKLMYGESFRTPTMLELYFDHPTVVGTPGLNPETSRSVELSYVGLFKEYSIQTTMYYAKYNDLIQRVRPDATKPAFYKNEISFGGLGFELENKFQTEYFDGFLNYNYIQGLDDDSKSNYDLIPRHTLAFGVSRSFNHFRVNTDGYFYSKTTGLLDEIPAQFMLNAGMAYEHKLKGIVKITHFLNVKNLTGSDMLIPEYIRRLPNINDFATTAYGTTFMHTMKISL